MTHVNERSVDLDVTTSLRPPTAELRRGNRRARQLDTIEVPTLTHNGVPRSGFFRAVPRLSTWHRPYATALLLLDWLGVSLASFTAISLYAQAETGFTHSRTLFTVVAYVFLPLGWVIILWGHGAYDRRYLGVGADEVVHSLVDAVHARTPVEEFQRRVRIHPTVSELLPTVLENLKPAA